jgi:hypothetical protein
MEQRGQARLPDSELNELDRWCLLEWLSNWVRPCEQSKLSGWEGGLAPARWLSERFQTLC